jgi:enterochelin esterase-like enzyme
MVVYLPPGYSTASRYPVLYLLHGAGDDETAWRDHGKIGSIMDDMYASRKLKPMIVVMPNAQGRGAAIENDLLQEIIPYIEFHYAARADRESRAIAGVSMGGGQAIRIGLNHPDKFAWVGGFSASLTGKEPRELLPDPNKTSEKLKLLWISCGKADHLFALNESLLCVLEDKNISHIWEPATGGHDWPLWRINVMQFAMRLFR